MHLSSAVLLQIGSQRNRARREEDRHRERKISIPLAASVPFSLSGAGNLPRNVTESINSFLPLITTAHHITANMGPIKSLRSARIVALAALY